MKRLVGLALAVASLLSITRAFAANADIQMAACSPSSASIIQIPSRNGIGVGGGDRFIQLVNEDGNNSCGLVCTPQVGSFPNAPCTIVMEVIEPTELTPRDYMIAELCTDSGRIIVNCKRKSQGGEPVGGGQLVGYDISCNEKINSFSIYLTKRCSVEIGGIVVFESLTSNRSAAQQISKAQENTEPNNPEAYLTWLPPDLNSGVLYGPDSGPTLAEIAIIDLLVESIENPGFRGRTPGQLTQSASGPLLTGPGAITTSPNQRLSSGSTIVSVVPGAISTEVIPCAKLHLTCN